ncbi:MAG: hypothetical protein IBJ11_09860 [Phycisphaerales bacterium]|nr:hypothetical protein [Phycisphaerales bacterium]
MPRMFPSVLTCLVLALFLTGPAHAGFRKPNVLLAAADNSTYTADVKAKLDALGVFGTVTVRDLSAPNVTPTLAELRAFDAVMVWSNFSFADSVALGNVMADYVDAGGGVVAAVFATTEVTAGRRLLGRWSTGNYSLITPAGGDTRGTAATLGTVSPANNNDLILNGVKTFNGGSESFRPTLTTLLPGAFVVANWSDGKILAAASTILPGRVDLGMFPPSAAVDARFWNPVTDGARLMANALLRTIRPRVLVVHADSVAGAPDDVAAKLRSTGKIGLVDIFNGSTGTPTLAQLLTYDATLVYSDLAYANPNSLGDNLATYTDRGGGVVQAVFATGSVVSDAVVGGRFALEGYALMNASGGRLIGPTTTLGSVAYPGHPIMAGVASFNGGSSSFRPTSTALPSHATVIANWSDGKLLAVTSTRFPNRADLGFYPASSTVLASFWNAATDGAKLLANTVEYVVKPYVAVIGSDSTASTFNTDITGKLAGLRRFSAVDVFQTAAVTPNNAQLRPYSGLFVYSNLPPLDRVALGNNLAAFVDQGGGVVVAPGAQASVGGFSLLGAWVPGYELIPSAGTGAQIVTADVGTVFIPSHPILRGVARLPIINGAFLTNTTVTNGPRLANFNSGGITLATVSSSKRRADLGLFPPSTAANPSGWDTRTDGATLMANALEWVIATTPCPGDIDGDGAVGANDLTLALTCFGQAITPGACAAADLDGNGTIATNDLTLVLVNFGKFCKR